jgi:hypothetical protein
LKKGDSRGFDEKKSPLTPLFKEGNPSKTLLKKGRHRKARRAYAIL